MSDTPKNQEAAEGGCPPASCSACGSDPYALEAAKAAISTLQRDLKRKNPPPGAAFLVMCFTDYEGANVEALFFDPEKARNLRDKLNAHKKRHQPYSVEEWKDEGRGGWEI